MDTLVHALGILDGMIKPQPMLRWAGGKRQLLETLIASFPKDLNLQKHNYFEPFFGGGALFFSLANFPMWVGTESFAGKSNHFVLSDTNEDLINFYSVVRDHPKLLIKALTNLASRKSERDFYRVRSSKPRGKVDRAARLLYLNRLCFNGLYRVNSNGEFNVPYGRLKNPVICNSELILSCSSWLKNAELCAESFEVVVKRAKRGDLVYFDPPYIPLSTTSSFSSYAKENFNESDQRVLAQTINDLTKSGVSVILSNSDTPLSREIFGSLNLFSIPANRSISAAGTSRGRVQELVGINFSLSAVQNALILEKFKVR